MFVLKCGTKKIVNFCLLEQDYIKSLEPLNLFHFRGFYLPRIVGDGEQSIKAKGVRKCHSEYCE